MLVQVHSNNKKAIPFFFGPLHMTASSGLDNKNPTDMTHKLSWIYWKYTEKYMHDTMSYIREKDIGK